MTEKNIIKESSVILSHNMQLFQCLIVYQIFKVIRVKML